MTAPETDNAIDRREKTASQANQYKSVSIHPGESACPAASKFGNRRILASQAPALPLGSCSAETCTCRYFTYGDRRSCLSNRRVSTEALPKVASLFRHGNRRKGVDRRKVKVDFVEFA